MRVLVVEDDRPIADAVVSGLRREGFDVEHVADGQSALAAEGHDLVLLDLGLPDLDGIEVCRRLRARSSIPIVILSARGDELDRVLGLELGADDYVVKPFSMRELVARVRAVGRRTAGHEAHEGPVPGPDEARIVVGPLTIDHRTHRVTVDGDEVALTPREYDILAFLAEDPGAVRSREAIIAAVWDTAWIGPTKTVDAHVASLRKKLGDPRWIEAVRGVGFRLDVPQP